MATAARKTVAPPSVSAKPSDELQPLLVKVPEAAALLRMSVPQARNFIRAGVLRTIRIGHDPRVPMEEVRRVAREGLPKLPRTLLAA